MNFLAMGNDELEKAPRLGRSVRCPVCSRRHRIQDSVDQDGRKGTLQFYKCEGNIYLAGLNGKDIRSK